MHLFSFEVDVALCHHRCVKVKFPVAGVTFICWHWRCIAAFQIASMRIWPASNGLCQDIVRSAMANQDVTYNVMRSVRDKSRRLKIFYRIDRLESNRRKKQGRPEKAGRVAILRYRRTT